MEMGRRYRREQVIHRAVIDHLQNRAQPGCVYWHTPNGAFYGGRRRSDGTSIQGGIMQGLGVRAGVPDLLLFHKSHLHGLELKAPGGQLSPAQAAFLHDIATAGGSTCVANDLDEALYQLERWGLLRGITQ